MLQGERDPKKLVELRDPQITRSTKSEMMKALKGDWRPELLFVLEQSLRAWEFYQAQMRACDAQIEEQLKQVPSATPPPSAAEAKSGPDLLADPQARPKAKQSRKRNDPERDLRPELARICGTDLTAAHGLRLLTVLTIVSETGVDMSKWRSAKAFTSWLGLNPNNKISGGRVLSSRTRKVVNRVSTALRMGAVGVAETNTWLGSFHRRMRARLGPAGANTATARKIATVIYHLLKTKEPFIDRDVVRYEARVYRHKLSRLKKQAKVLGYELVQTSEQKQFAE
jgi:hypothetical protein